MISALAAVWLGLALACASGEKEDIPLAAPPELRQAKLLYSRDDGIYLQTPGERTAMKVVDAGVYPRWSPDGKSFAFIRGNDVMLHEFDGQKTRRLAGGNKLRAVAYHPDGEEVWYINGNAIESLRIADGTTRMIIDNIDVRELDIASDGSFFAATVKRRVGYRVEVFDSKSGQNTIIGRGCSASISPDMRHITVNAGDHTQMSLRHRADGSEWKSIMAPPGFKLDNQKWSNKQDWIVAISEGANQYVMVHRVSDGQAWRITSESDCDRPDLFIP